MREYLTVTLCKSQQHGNRRVTHSNGRIIKMLIVATRIIKMLIVATRIIKMLIVATPNGRRWRTNRWAVCSVTIIIGNRLKRRWLKWTQTSVHVAKWQPSSSAPSSSLTSSWTSLQQTKPLPPMQFYTRTNSLYLDEEVELLWRSSASSPELTASQWFLSNDADLSWQARNRGIQWRCWRAGRWGRQRRSRRWSASAGLGMSRCSELSPHSVGRSVATIPKFWCLGTGI